jgi:hypothetical protein
VDPLAPDPLGGADRPRHSPRGAPCSSKRHWTR